MQAIDYLILLVAGACLGSLTKVRDESFGAPGYTHTIIAVCKLNNLLVQSIISFPEVLIQFLFLIISFVMQNCGFEDICIGQVTILERKCFWH